jgi:hypothetical protein
MTVPFRWTEARPVSVALTLAALTASAAVSCRTAGTHPAPSEVNPSRGQAEADAVRATERERLRALVSADLESARRLHADDFQLITPSGGAVTKEQYLGGIASGSIHYLEWEPDSIAVRVYGPAAVIRYRSQLEIVVQGQKIPRRPYWHIDLYEKRDGGWQVVWSQATEIK